jgi:uncharacterized membrane protein YheB (UPF0754 family)
MKNIEKQRVRLRSLEKELEPFGFDSRKGLETYSLQEIRKLAKRNRFSKNFLKTLNKCLHKHMDFYRTLHHEGFEPLSIERDMPEKNVQAIQEWLTNLKKGAPLKKTKESISSALSRCFLEKLKQTQTPNQLEEWYGELRRFYKREYDIYRFADMLARVYNEYVGYEAITPDQLDVAKSTKKILRALAIQKLENNNFLEFISDTMNKNRGTLKQVVEKRSDGEAA